MTSRLLLPFSLLITVAASAQDTTTWAANYATELVDPFVGTGGHGHTFPGACVPFGMVQLSPDTRTDPQEWDGCGGYHYSDSLIYGFSHTHLSGTGVADLCDVLTMPVSGGRVTEPAQYRSRFSHKRESAHAGYYRVHLDDPGIDVELTATARAGMQRYSFSRAEERSITLDLRHRDKLLASSIKQTAPGEIVGERRSSSWARDQHLFFCIRINRDVSLDPALSDSTKASIILPSDDQPVLVKVGISAVSIDGARKNLEAELPGWDFDSVRKQAENAWDKELGRIQVQGGTPEQRRVFYTALYHCLLVPYIFNDVDGKYRGDDGKVHQGDHNVYTVFSLWDTFRAEHPLFTILEPDRTVDFIKTFLDIYKETGHLPVWELWGNETDCMIGYHSVSVIADAYIKGIRGFDAKLALKAMVASAMRDEPGLNAYRRQGYISSEDQGESVSRTLEYAYDDWCIARMAQAMGRDSLAKDFFARGDNWRNLFDPSSGFFRARYNGGFKGTFDPYEVNVNYTEANAWQYSTFVPQDVDGLDQTLRNTGHGGLEQRLDDLFGAKTSTTGRDQSDITGLIGQYAHGNEPSHAMAWMYCNTGRQDKARRMVDQILNFYRDTPDGLIGNEDCGQMSAWYVLSALGLYQVSPGDPTFEVLAPIFHAYRIQLPNGKEVNVRCSGGTEGPRFIRSTMLNGKRGRLTNLSYTTLMQGMDLGIGLTSMWRPLDTEVPHAEMPVAIGAIAAGHIKQYPPTAPVITAPAQSFKEPMTVALSDLGNLWPIHYTVDGSTPTLDSPKYKAPFQVAGSGEVKAIAGDHGISGPVVHAQFHRIDPDRTIKVESKWAAQYAAGGENALIDGVRGNADWRTGAWQGYHGTDVVASVDLGSVKTLKRLGLGVLQDEGAWIWYPSSVQFAWSTNGRNWSSATVGNTVPRNKEGRLTMDMMTQLLNKHARYIKVIAKSAGACPDWHPGKGKPSWIFTDELVIECE